MARLRIEMKNNIQLGSFSNLIWAIAMVTAEVISRNKCPLFSLRQNSANHQLACAEVLDDEFLANVFSLSVLVDKAEAKLVVGKLGI